MFINQFQGIMDMINDRRKQTFFISCQFVFFQNIMSPVPDNIFLFDDISIVSPSLTWSTLIIVTSLGSVYVLPLLWVTGNKCVKCARYFIFPVTSMCPWPTCYNLVYINFLGMKNQTKLKQQQTLISSRWRWKKKKKTRE